MNKIRNASDLAALLGANGTSEEALSRRVYKATDCGAWLAKTHDGVQVGSIVEGTDATTDTHDLQYPFTPAEFWTALEEVEAEASYIWNQTHGCDRCGIEGEWGDPAINPECKSCHGQGAVI